jgi:hypothetical protein
MTIASNAMSNPYRVGQNAVGYEKRSVDIAFSSVCPNLLSHIEGMVFLNNDDISKKIQRLSYWLDNHIGVDPITFESQTNLDLFGRMANQFTVLCFLVVGDFFPLL